MKYYFYLIFFLNSVFLNAQDAEEQKFVTLAPKPRTAQAYLDLNAAQVFSTFKFSYKLVGTNDANAASSPYSQLSTNSFGIGYTYVRKDGIMFLGGLSFRKAGATMVYKASDYQWNLQYIELKAGIGYQYDKWRLKPFATLSPYYAYLLNAKQAVGLNYYDIKTSKAIKSSDLGASLGLGLKVALSPYILIFSQYDYNLGFKNIENDPQQYLYNRGFDLKVGLVFSITDFNSMQDYIAKQEELQKDGGLNYMTNNDLANNQATKPQNPSNQELIAKNTTSPKTQTSTNTESNGNSNPDDKIVTPGTVGWGNNSKSAGQNKASNSKTTPENNNSTVIKNNAKVSDPSKGTGNSENSTKTSSEKTKSEKENKNKVEFRIQLTTTKNLLNDSHPLLKKSNGSNIDAEKGRDGLTRYYLGSYETYEEAKSDLSEVKAMGIASGCFIVAFQNGKKITVAQAKALVK